MAVFTWTHSHGLFRSGNFNKATKYLHRQLVALWKDSVGAFIQEALKHVHVDTGMSAASFQPLAANVKMQSIISESLRGRGPKKGFPDGSIKDLEFKDSEGPFKSRALGARLGRRAYDLTFGTPSLPEMNFVFRIVVFQYYLNESGYGNQAAWDSLLKARDAFLANWKSRFDDFVDARAYGEIIVWGETNAG